MMLVALWPATDCGNTDRTRKRIPAPRATVCRTVPRGPTGHARLAYHFEAEATSSRAARPTSGYSVFSFTGRFSITSSTIPNSLACSALMKVSRSMRASISESVWPVCRM